MRSDALGHSVSVTAPAKINLHLEVLGLRPDGFHELAMVMQSIELADQLQFTSTADGTISLGCDDSSLSTAGDNLIVRAAQLLRDRSAFPELGVAIDLQKRIPIGAGLAGGSSDGAATLVGLNALWGLDFSQHQLEDFAAELGSDMPFCLAGGSQLCFGRGERLEPLPALKAPMAVVLVKDPSVSVSTPWAYGLCRELSGSRYLQQECDFEQRRQALRDASWLRPLRVDDPPPLRNDLQEVVAPEVAAVQVSLKLLSDLPGSLAVAMSGSGPSCFALFADFDSAQTALASQRQLFTEAGLTSWCTALRAEGVKLEQ
ncbi:MAG: 4-(cytidine 5'-diphospho)-2-C-methyl-D-erythritol kinase [Prochlorococcus sp.]